MSYLIRGPCGHIYALAHHVRTHTVVWFSQQWRVSVWPGALCWPAVNLKGNNLGQIVGGLVDSSCSLSLLPHANCSFSPHSPPWVTAPWPWPLSTRCYSDGTVPSMLPSTIFTCPPLLRWSWSSRSSCCWAAWFFSCPACPESSERSAAAGRRPDTSASLCRRLSATCERSGGAGVNTLSCCWWIISKPTGELPMWAPKWDHQDFCTMHHL